MGKPLHVLPILAALLALAAAPPADPPPRAMTREQAFARAAALADLGRRAFFDPRLSASGAQSCASCHDPAHGFSPANDLPVQPGGAHLDRAGTRAAPGLTYLQAVPAFTEHFHESDEEADESVDNGPTGGLTWDGRVDTAAAQAMIPLLSANEMANLTVEALAERARAAGYAHGLAAIDGAEAAASPQRIAAGLGAALAAFQQTSALFFPYSSKYDAVLAGRATLTAQEARGLAAFEDPARGNCARCHVSRPGLDGTPPQFTDYGMIAVGAPRNPAIPANADPAYFDLGVCGPLRADMAAHPEYCGLFRTPSLRNVALRRSYFHNGVFHDLRDAVAFYASRDTDPARWYPKNPDGSVRKFDDLPAQYRANLDDEPPFDGRRPGDPPALTGQEIDDIAAFLRTLTDGWGG
ncbi:MAG: c-type cytochrome [Proteobacteria bacterium]|nr:c-type cytochrome [Pseudomonadota bacterium]